MTARLLPILTALLLLPVAAAGTPLRYTHGDTTCVGYLARPPIDASDLPGVLVVHDWMGPSDWYRGIADKLAAMNYVALAVDVYGVGGAPTSRKTAGAVAGRFKKDPALFRGRLQAGLKALLATGVVDPRRVAAVGYCFGGTGVLELARSGAAVAGVVSVHGGLKTAAPLTARGTLKAKLLVLHGAADPHVPPAEVAAFMAEMDTAGADWQMVHYAGAVHAFSKPSAGNDPSRGAAYQPAAARRSWAHMRVFFEELFARPSGRR